MLAGQTYAADVYTDLAGLAPLRLAASRRDAGAVMAVAKQFEALFLQMIMKSMRSAQLSEGLLDNDQTKLYQDLYDKQLSLALSQQDSIGLADIIARQLSGNSDDSDKSITGNSVDGELFTQGVVNAKDGTFTTAKQFIDTLSPYAQEAAQKLGTTPRLLVAQAALETAWGKQVLQKRNGQSSHNYFAIKADTSWHGETVRTQTLEFESGLPVRRAARFRAYDSIKTAFDDYAQFIQGQPRYAQALANAADPRAYMHGLQQAHYASDPDYANKVLALMDGSLLTPSNDKLKNSVNEPL